MMDLKKEISNTGSTGLFSELGLGLGLDHFRGTQKPKAPESLRDGGAGAGAGFESCSTEVLTSYGTVLTTYRAKAEHSVDHILEKNKTLNK